MVSAAPMELYNGSSTLIFKFIPQASADQAISKESEFDPLPFSKDPDAYDSLAQNSTLTVRGTIKPLAAADTVSGTNESVRERYNLMRGWLMYSINGTVNPASVNEFLFTLRMYFPDNEGYDSMGTPYEEFDVVITNATFNFGDQPLTIPYTIQFREAATITLI